MPRIAPLDFDSAPEAVKQLLSPDRPNEIALVFGHAETNWPRLADLLLSILDQFDIPRDQFGDSTGHLPGLV